MTVLGPPEKKAAPTLQWRPTPCTLTADQKVFWDAVKIKVMRNHPFFTFLLVDRFKELIFTKDIPTAATDGFRTIAINPDYFLKKSVGNGEFAVCHEVGHSITEHILRAKAFQLVGAIGGVKFHWGRSNIAQDLRLNKDLVDSGVGEIHKDWLFDASVGDNETWEDIYVRMYEHDPLPPGPGGEGEGEDGSGGPYNEDAKGRWRGQSFDGHLPPPIDPTTGQPMKPDVNGMKEAVLQAAAFAKSQGKFPAGFQKVIDALMEPQIDWEEQLAATLLSKIGRSDLSFQRPHRRRMAVSYRGMVTIMPGLAGKNAGNLWIGGDSSGSMHCGKEMETVCSEICGIITLARPNSVKLAWCDAAVHRVDEIEDVSDLEEALKLGVPGGGGTDFRPVFDEIERRGERPDALVFLTDGYGDFPGNPPSYPVIWCMTTDVEPPFGEVVRVVVR